MSDTVRAMITPDDFKRNWRIYALAMRRAVRREVVKHNGEVKVKITLSPHHDGYHILMTGEAI